MSSATSDAFITCQAAIVMPGGIGAIVWDAEELACPCHLARRMRLEDAHEIARSSPTKKVSSSIEA